jgi:transposase
LGSKHHLITDANGVPLAAILTQANRNDITQLLPLVDGIPPIGGKMGHPRHRPDTVQGDRAYDSHPHRQELRDRQITPVLAARRTPHGSGLGMFRWVIERSISWLHQYRRLRVRYERRPDIHEGFMTLACILICHKRLVSSFC